ncbi:redoxin domain-containing protein [Planctomicrobium piriforme]|uniref:Peroxiredoxin n=1 Tax=Planctomicrobium piriforme TaxID=1576369 RepID=A0A1I3ATJ1_9PLAN|nr:redoxin domain-containing protein [Planctomicrobium piriforme]SFH53397.1 Peroxiredoxin [Planctomicrobium piriforme]
MHALRLCLLGCLLIVPSIAGAEQKSLEFKLPDHRGHEVSLQDFGKSKTVVVAFLGTQCPLAKLYAVRLQELAGQYSPDDVAFIAVDSNTQDSLAEITAFIRQHQLSYPVLKDLGAKVADRFSAQRTPQVFLLDASRTVRYSGRVDDQYLVGVMRDKPQRADLKAAIDEVLAGKPVSVATTSAIGCLIGRSATPKADSPVTYSNQIARIFQNHCVECHRPGEIGPFPMLSYDDVAGWGPMIAEVVSEQRMPPWHADPHFGKFVNDTSLNADEKEQIATWVKNGCPEGNPSELPEPKTFVEGWQLSKEPDAVVVMADKPYVVPADGGKEGIRYQQFWAPTNLKEDSWMTGGEVRPGNRAVVHHVIVYVHPEGKRTKKHDFLTAYVPGLRMTPLPPGAAKKIPAGSWLRFEIHYTPNGQQQEDLTSVGFVFADPEQITHEVKTTVAGSRDFVIQPQLDNQTFSGRSPKSPIDVQLISMSPHMHLRGKSFEYIAEYPDGRKEVLLKVPHYDFNWQTRYTLVEAITLPAGTVIRCNAAFDNSPRNLANPDPSATVRWGDQSWEEMLLGYMDIMYPAGPGRLAGARAGLGLPPGLDAASILKHVDKNSDGKVSREEAKAAPLLDTHFERVDQNKDGFVTDTELKEALAKLAASI